MKRVKVYKPETVETGPESLAESFDKTVHEFIDVYESASTAIQPAPQSSIDLDRVIAEKTRIGLEVRSSVEQIVANLDGVTRKILQIRDLSLFEKLLSFLGERGKNQAVKHHLGRIQRQDLSGNIARTIDLSRFYEQSLDLLIHEGQRELGELRKLRDRLNEDYTRCVGEAQTFKQTLDVLDKEAEAMGRDLDAALPEERGKLQGRLDRKLDERREVHARWQDRSIRGNLARENYETARNYVEAFDAANQSMRAIGAKLQYAVDQTAEILRKTVSVFKKADTVRGSACMFDAYRETLDHLHRITGEAVSAIAAESSRILDLSLNDPRTQEEKRLQIESGARELTEALRRNYDLLASSDALASDGRASKKNSDE